MKGGTKWVWKGIECELQGNLNGNPKAIEWVWNG